ncbi:MAG: amino acid permease [Chlamydiae bacterium]|nr:amino acid permease [Chlamydiota bacterium]
MTFSGGSILTIPILAMKKNEKINLFQLLMLTIALVVSIRNLPAIAETGMHMFFLAFVGAIGFFIPASLVSAELATGWPKIGGISVWAKEAFGGKWDFIAAWLQWTYLLISVTAMLYFIGGSLAYVFAPDLAQNKLFLIAMQFIIVWVFTLLHLKGLKTSSFISTIGFLTGVFIPGFLIIAFGLFYIFLGHPLQMPISFTADKLFPDFHHLSTMVLLVAFMRAFAGVEVSAAHANKVENPQRNYPIAVLITVIIGLAINTLGPLSIAVVIPKDQISLVAGIMETFAYFFKAFHLEVLIPVLGIMVAMGQMGSLSTWLIGPVKGLYEAATRGNLPPIFQRLNKHDVPVNLLICQAIIICLFSSFFLLMSSNINISFWISVALSMMIYVTMYFIMFLAALYLRYSKPDVPRAFKVPFKKTGIWTASILGMVSMIFSFMIALIPPAELPDEHHNLYIGTLVVSIVLIYILPFVFGIFKKPSWKKEI